MKKIVFLIAIITMISCSPAKLIVDNTPAKIDSTEYYKAQCDTLTFLAIQYEKFLINSENKLMDTGDSIQILSDSIQIMADSIVRLNERPLMTKAQFLDLYRYERVKKYYAICIKNPTQWKYIKGWLRRAIVE